MESTNRIDRANSNVTITGVPINDRRGKFGSHGKIAEERLRKIITHISKHGLDYDYT